MGTKGGCVCGQTRAEECSHTLRHPIPILGLQHHQEDHGRYQANGGHDQGKDDAGWRVPQLLQRAVLEVLGVDLYKDILHHRIGPWNKEAISYLLTAR